jgi:hypothetical protein
LSLGTRTAGVHSLSSDHSLQLQRQVGAREPSLSKHSNPTNTQPGLLIGLYPRCEFECSISQSHFLNLYNIVAIARKVVQTTYALAKTNKSLQEANEELDIIAYDLRLALPAIRVTNLAAVQVDENGESFNILVEKAEDVSKKIEGILGAIKAKRSKGWRGSISATIKALRLDDDLKSLNERISGLRDQIGIRINMTLL